MTAQYYIQHLQLQPHPEGGFYKETYRSPQTIPSTSLAGFNGERSCSTAIYFLLQRGDFSAFHRIKSDEAWHFYAGEALLIHVIEAGGNYYCIRLGNNMELNERFQFVVPANAWFASEPAQETAYALVGCTVAPGFDFDDFEMAKKENLLQEFSLQTEVISRLCR